MSYGEMKFLLLLLRLRIRSIFLKPLANVCFLFNVNHKLIDLIKLDHFKQFLRKQNFCLKKMSWLDIYSGKQTTEGERCFFCSVIRGYSFFFVKWIKKIGDQIVPFNLFLGLKFSFIKPAKPCFENTAHLTIITVNNLCV